MRKFNIYAMAAALLALAGCERGMAPEGAGGITVQASIGTMTKVSYDGNTTSFTVGDRIAVYAWTGSAAQVPAKCVVNGEVNTFDGTAWTPANPMEWDGLTKAHYFLGIMPVAAVSDFTADPYTLNPADYTASDLLIATSLDGITPSAAPVDLTFTHAMAKLNVNLKFRSEFGGTPTVIGVTVKAKKTATVNYLTKAVTATGDASEVDIPATATAATGYALGFSGLQVPQSGVTTVTVTIAGKTYVYKSATDIPLESGKYTTMGLVVGKDKVELGSVEVSDWTAGTDLPGGEAVMQIVHDYVDMGEVDINGVTKHLYWATCNIGADNPWDYGDYYAWGATATQTNYDWANYPFMQAGQADWDYITKYTYADGKTVGIWYDNGGNFIGDGKTSFADYDYADDAARQIWGGDWRVPTDAEWTALRDDALYDWVWTDDYLGDGSNHSGRIVTRKDNTGPCSGNSIFLPTGGVRNGTSLDYAGVRGTYWSSTLYDGYSSCPWAMFFRSDVVDRANIYPRCGGRSLRPVFCERYPLAAADIASIDIGKVLAADGNIYANAAQASAAGTEARAVIAYVGSVPNYFDKFLAIAIEDADVNYYEWADAHTAVGTFADSHAIYIGGTNYNSDAIGGAFYDQVADDVNATSATRTAGVVKGWRLPSVTDWRYIFDGLGRQKAGLTITAEYGNTIYSSNATPNDPLGVRGQMYYYKDGDAYDASSLRAAINAACGNTALKSYPYWSSSEKSKESGIVWDYDFYLGNFSRYEKENDFYVRAVFAY
ncbi:MAG: fimbrillin family protein [Bacteroidales bacterium]|nr:fimbrillin family protein [Bacteroidales bacterium]